MSLFTEHPGIRWAIPVAAVAVIGATTFVTSRTASADAGLAPRTAAQLLVDVQQAQLESLSGTVVQTADLDPLRDEGQAYAAQLRAAGVATRTTNYLGTPHGFMSFPGATVSAPQARLELATELRQHLAPPSTAPSSRG